MTGKEPLEKLLAEEICVLAGRVLQAREKSNGDFDGCFTVKIKLQGKAAGIKRKVNEAYKEGKFELEKKRELVGNVAIIQNRLGDSEWWMSK